VQQRLEPYHVPSIAFTPLTPEWYSRVHSRDDEFNATELAALDFAEKLEKQVWPAIGEAFTLPVPEFEQPADYAREYIERIFARVHQTKPKSWWRFW
jgi:hypothetical protein